MSFIIIQTMMQKTTAEHGAGQTEDTQTLLSKKEKLIWI
jgi:hypothetical protein